VFQVLVLVASLENIIEQLDQSTRKEVQVSSGNGSSINRADFSALVEIKDAFSKEYQLQTSKYSKFFYSIFLTPFWGDPNNSVKKFKKIGKII